MLFNLCLIGVPVQLTTYIGPPIVCNVQTFVWWVPCKVDHLYWTSYTYILYILFRPLFGGFPVKLTTYIGPPIHIYCIYCLDLCLVGSL